MHAVIVAGHAIPRDLAPKSFDPSEDASWHLLPFQRGEAACYVEHIHRGVELAAALSAKLVFTGGQTRQEAGPLSEAEGYRRVAAHFAWWGHAQVAARTLTEEFARDSFENLLFSLAHLQQQTGHWPAHIHLVSWEFKQARFHLHREAIRWPENRFTYIAANNPPDLPQASAAETRNRAAYQQDPYSASPEFQAKKRARNPFERQHPYTTAALAALLAHQGPQLFTGPVPWHEA